MIEEITIRKCIDGDRVSQEMLYNFYAQRMKAICLRYAKSIIEAEDIFQDAFIKVFTNLKNAKNMGSFDGWIRRIVTNTAKDHYKNNQRYSRVIELENLGKDPGFNEIDSTLNEKELLNVLNNLPPGYLLIFNLYAIEGFTHKEIAAMLKINEGTSRSQLTKARKLIRDMLKESNRENQVLPFLD